jgi:hypothetical protein
VHNHGAYPALQVSPGDEVLAAAGKIAPLYRVGYIRIAALILCLVELSTLKGAAKQEAKQLGWHYHMLRARFHGANGFYVPLKQMIGRNEHI